MFSSRNLIIGAALLAIAWAAFVVGGRYYVQRQISAANAEMFRGNHQAAIEQLAAADRFQPNNTKVHFQLAVAYRRMDDPDSFRVHLAQAEKLNYPNPIELDMQMTMMAAQSGVSVEAMRDKLALAPDDVATADFVEQVYEALARGYLKSGNTGEATNYLLKWIDHRPEAVPPRLLAARVHTTHGNRVGALEYLRKCLEIDPSSRQAAVDFFQLLEGYNENDADDLRLEASTALRNALEKDPNDSTLLLACAEDAYQAEDFDRARELSQQALDAFPDTSVRRETLVLLGKLSTDDGDYEQAAELLEAAVATRPLDKEPYWLLAQVYRQLRNDSKADFFSKKSTDVEKLNERILEIHRELADASEDTERMAELADILWQLDHQEEAAGWLQRVLSIEPENTAAARRLAEFYQRQGRADLAEQYLIPAT